MASCLVSRVSPLKTLGIQLFNLQAVALRLKQRVSGPGSRKSLKSRDLGGFVVSSRRVEARDTTARTGSLRFPATCVDVTVST